MTKEIREKMEGPGGKILCLFFPHVPIKGYWVPMKTASAQGKDLHDEQGGTGCAVE